MPALAPFFETNRVILYSAYGQVFFVLGLAVLLQSRRYSRLPLARSLWLLGAFGITHGLAEWAYVFNPIQAQYLTGSVISLLWLVHVLLEAISFAFLFQFGADLVGAHGRLPWLRFLPSAAIALWVLLFLDLNAFVGLGLAAWPGRVVLANADALGRYLMALPGAILSSAGLLQEVKIVKTMELPGIARYLKVAAIAFVAYALLAGLLVPSAGFFPATILNNDLPWKTLGIPVPVFRSICGLVIVVCIVKALKVFDVEMDRMIEKMERAHMIALERERIGRELHDGTVQSLYATGLALEDIRLTISKDGELARQKVREVMTRLNRTIGEVRRYILDLHGETENREFEDQLKALAAEFTAQAGIVPLVQIGAEWRRPMTSVQASQLLQVVREAFANACRHAAASQVEVVLTYGRDGVTLEIRDDGCGFDPDEVAQRSAQGHNLGLLNIARRLEMIGGTLQIHAAPGLGTRLTADVPLEGGQTELAAHITRRRP